ncbi:MAG: IS1595 family transposase [Gemmatimonadales bacterium]
MDILKVFHSFKTQEQCLAYLEQKRWGGAPPACIYCGSVKVGRHASGDRANQRWQCQDCHASFAVTVGTIFHRTHIPLQQWFLVLALMLNAKKSASACQIARDLGMRRPTVWSMMHRIRAAMAQDEAQGRLLYGLVEADETYVGGKPRRGNGGKGGKGQKAVTGRGTKKAIVLGAVERGGRVVAECAPNANGTTIDRFLSRVIDRAGTLLVTDEWIAYSKYGRKGNWGTINQQREYVNGIVHTNTIESFWALVKRAWYGQHHHYSRKYMPLYVAEAAYKYNNRKNGNGFDSLIAAAVA